MIELRGFGENRSFLVIFRDFQMHLTLRQIDRLTSQIKALFSTLIAFLWNIFCHP